MTRTPARLALLTMFVLCFVATWAPGAQADCIGPTFNHTSGDLAHGATLTITGYGFGDNCYDTGPPPPGEGALGRPLTDIEVWLDQDGDRHLVAVGNADEAYEWVVDVAVPAVLDVGTVDVSVTTGSFEAFDETDTQIWVTSDAEPNVEFEVNEFGPVGSERAEAVGEPEFSGTNWTPMLLLVGSATVVGGILVVLQRRGLH